jgi:flagella basal body P-ring formation protein FlgA
MAYLQHLKRSALIVLAVCLTPANGSTTADAGALQSHNSIREAARQHILEHSEEYPAPPDVQAGHLDNRLRLAACGQPLQTFSPPGKRLLGKVTVGVRCDGDKPWTLYVPLNVSVMSQVVVAKTELTRGSTVTREDVKLEKRDIARLHRGYLESLDKAIGKTVKYSVRSNQVVTPSRIDSPLAVKRNGRVTILAANSSVQVRMTGTALENGSIGQRIRVKNRSSERELEARVVGQGIVQVTL